MYKSILEKKDKNAPYSVNQYIADRVAAGPQEALKIYEAQRAGLLTTPITVAPYAQEKVLPVNYIVESNAEQRAATVNATTPTTVETPTAVETPKADWLDELRGKMQDSLKVLEEKMNSTFAYSERSSPIYSILREEYQKQADRAAAQAYDRSVANTGGYGSSYATLAAEEASRQVMDGWSDVQYDLYNAALQQFENEKASAAEAYSVYKGLLEEAEAEAAAEAEALEQEQLLLEEKQNERETIILNAYGATSESWAETGGANEATIRSMIRNSLPAGTENPQEIVDEVISRLKSDTAAAQSDAFREFKNTPTLAAAQAIYDSAKRSGSLAEYEGEMSAALMTLATDALGGDADAAAALGLNAQVFSELDADGKAAAVLDVMGQMKKNGLIREDAFVSFLIGDMNEDLNKVKSSKYNERFDAAVSMAREVMDMYEKKYLTEEEYDKLMLAINEKTDIVRYMTYKGETVVKYYVGFNDNEEEKKAYFALGRVALKYKK